MAEHVELHIGRVVLADIALWYLKGNPLHRIKMNCIHNINLFNVCIECDQHFENRVLRSKE